MTNKKKAPKPAADGSTKYVSLATGNFVTEAYARRNPDKVAEGVTKLPKGAVVVDGPVEGAVPANPSLTKVKKKAKKKAAKKTRIVKRVKSGKKGGEFAKKTAHGSNVTNDIVAAPARKTALKKAAAATTVAKKAVKAAKKAVKVADSAVTRATKLTDAIGASTKAIAKKRPGSKVAKKLARSGGRGG